MVFDPYKFYSNQPMHGYWHPHWHRGGRGGSRLLWFLFGVGATHIWMKHKECHSYDVKHCMRPRLPAEAYPPPAAAQQQVQQAPPVPPQITSAPDAQTLPPDAMTPHEKWERKWEKRWEWGWPPREREMQAQAAVQAPKQDEHRVLPPLPNPSEGWEDERQRLQKMTQQAAETLSDVSEAGLDSLLSTVESLKARITERRERRQREQAEQEAQRAERFRQFEEWRKQQEQYEKEKQGRLV